MWAQGRSNKIYMGHAIMASAALPKDNGQSEKWLYPANPAMVRLQ